MSAAFTRWSDTIARHFRSERVELSLVARQVFNELKHDHRFRWMNAVISMHTAQPTISNNSFGGLEMLQRPPAGPSSSISSIPDENAPRTAPIEREVVFSILTAAAPHMPPSALYRTMDILEDISQTNELTSECVGLVLLGWIAVRCGSLQELVSEHDKLISSLFGGANATMSDCHSEWCNNSGHSAGGNSSGRLNRWVEEQVSTRMLADMPPDVWGPTQATTQLAAPTAAAMPTQMELTISPQRPTSSNDTVMVGPVSPIKYDDDGDNAASPDGTCNVSGASSSAAAPLFQKSNETQGVELMLELLIALAPPRSTRLIELCAVDANMVGDMQRRQFKLLSRIAEALDMGDGTRDDTAAGDTPTTSHFTHLSGRVRGFFGNQSGPRLKRYSNSRPGSVLSPSIHPQVPLSGTTNGLGGTLDGTLTVDGDKAVAFGSVATNYLNTNMSFASEAATEASPARRRTPADRYALDSSPGSTQIAVTTSSKYEVNRDDAYSDPDGEDEDEDALEEPDVPSPSAPNTVRGEASRASMTKRSSARSSAVSTDTVPAKRAGNTPGNDLDAAEDKAARDQNADKPAKEKKAKSSDDGGCCTVM